MRGWAVPSQSALSLGAVAQPLANKSIIINAALVLGLRCDIVFFMEKKTSKGKAQAFIKKVLASQSESCILWPFYKNKGGYGQLWWDGKPRLAGRVVLLETQGPHPTDGDRYEAAHLPAVCHNRACINPRHLRWATAKENALDRRIDQTELIGEKTNSAKLTADDVVSIYFDNRFHREIALDFGVTPQAVQRIKSKKDWTHVTSSFPEAISARRLGRRV